MPLFMLLLAAIAWGLIIQAFWRRRLDGRVLVDIGRPANAEHTAMVVLSGIPVLILLALGLIARGDIFWFSLLVCFGSAFLFHLFRRIVSIQFTEKGISSFESLLKWQEITSYEWIGKEKLVLSLQVRRPFLWMFISGKTHWCIPYGHKNDVSGILTEHLPQPI